MRPLLKRLAGIKNIYCTVTGLGYVFTEARLLNLLKKIVGQLYKFSFKFANKIIFLNPDDREIFIKERIIEKEKSLK